jgi:hypothetical protein
VELLTVSLSKSVLSTTFIFIILSLYYVLLAKNELSKAFYNKNYSDGDLHKHLLHKIPVSIKIEDQIHKGYVSNWDKSGFFLRFSEALNLMNTTYDADLEFFNKKFAIKVTKHYRASDKKGFGFGPVLEEKNLDKYRDLCKIRNDLGLETALLK